MDLSVIFEIIVQEKDGAKASSVVTNELLNCWGISVDELYRDALDNTEAYCGVGCWSLVDMICEAASAVGAPKEELDAIFAQRDECPMWVVSTKNQFDGAIALIYARKSVLSETVGSPNFYVLPSSRHEFILSPDNEQSDIKRLRDRVMSTNRTSVVAEDYLSDSVYRYDAESDTFVIV